MEFEIGSTCIVKISKNTNIPSVEGTDTFVTIIGMERSDPNPNNWIYLVSYNDQIDPSGSFELTDSDYQGYDSDYRFVANLPKYNGKRSQWVDAERIYPMAKYDGYNCAKCNDYARMAAPNQKDGTFICYSCRSNPWR
jgi:hypothetical protein